MKYRHVVALRVLGITAPEEDIEVPVPAQGYRCVLTRAPDRHLADSDRSHAVVGLTLRQVFTPSQMPHGETEEERITALISAIRAERTKGQTNTYFVLRAEGEVDIQPSEILREAENAIVCLSVPGKKELRERLSAEVARTVTCMAVTFPRLAELESVRDAIDLFLDDGRQVTAFSMSAGDIQISIGVKESDAAPAAETANAFLRLRDLSRVESHLMQSLLMRKDRLRAFLSAWNALEIFINKVFEQYRAAFYARLSPATPGTQQVFMAWVIEVMEGKYKPSAKFALIAGSLAPDSCEADLRDFRRAKKLRNNFSHGDDIEEESLPTHTVLALLRKYLALHAGITPPGT